MKFPIKIKAYEFWPFWLFFAPFVPYWVMRSIQAGSFSYFSRVNPGMRFGGFLDYSKFAVLEQLPNEFKASTKLIADKSQIQNLPEFPVVLKPNFGERGVHVEVIRSKADWDNYPLSKQLILQEFIDLPCEFGIFCARNPNNQSIEILSVTGKEFLVFKADGKQSLAEFVETNPRAKGRKAYFQSKFKSKWNSIPEKNTEILLEPIGNHNRGTRFFDASYLISPKLIHTIESLANGIQGFHYGRFDVKAASEECLKNGEFIVLEVNGANSEPTHIYDSNYSLKQAYAEVKRHLDRQFEIAQTQKRTHSPWGFYRAIIQRLFPF